jgi:hypothetical protein
MGNYIGEFKRTGYQRSCSSNKISLMADALGSPDRVEFYNGTNVAIDLKVLSDSSSLVNGL